HLVHVARAVEQREEALLRVGEALADREVLLVREENQVERRNLLLDQAPLVDPARTFKEQRLGADRHQEILLLGPHLGFEVERPLRPREQVVDGFLDLNPHVALEVLLREDPHPHQDLPELPVALPELQLDRRVQLVRADRAVLDEDVPQPIAAVHDRRVADPALVEVDVAEVRPVGDREAPGLLPQGEELEHVGERGFLERALDRHQRNSSISRSGTSGQSHTVFSRLLMLPKLDTTTPLVRDPGARRPPPPRPPSPSSLPCAPPPSSSGAVPPTTPPASPPFTGWS